MSIEEKRGLVERNHDSLSIRDQCRLLNLNRASLYYEPVSVSIETLQIMNRIDEIYTKYPFYGSRKIKLALNAEGWTIGRERVQKLMRKMGICAVYPKPKLSARQPEHRVYPYLLGGYKIIRPNQVWSSDITYLRLSQGFLYLVAIIDWFSRYVMSWRLSNSLNTDFCIEALEEAFQYGRPMIFNTDQGCQFTSKEFTGALEGQKVRISMDGKGRALDNVFVERLWRTVKYEEVYLKGYQTGFEAKEGLSSYFSFYNNERYHQSLGYKTPSQVHNS